MILPPLAIKVGRWFGCSRAALIARAAKKGARQRYTQPSLNGLALCSKSLSQILAQLFPARLKLGSVPV
jgi:hypothetical protein